MISLIVEVALFFVVLFFLLPCVMIFLMIVREFIQQTRRQAGWQKSEGRELAG